MKKTLFLLFSLITLTSFSYPVSEWLIERKAYALAYDGQHKQAKWVCEILTAKNIQGNADRDHFNFIEDHLIPKALRASNKDYHASQFERGHLCPAKDARSSAKVMEETFFLSNISPQLPQFNRGYWLKLENHVRSLLKEYKTLKVFTGPLYLPHKASNGKKYVRYQVIGDNDVAVPTHYFKIIFAEKDKGKTDDFAYIIPNSAVENSISLEKFSVPISKVEKVSGILFKEEKK